MDEQEQKRKLKETFNTIAKGYDSPALLFFSKSAALLPGQLALQGDEHVLDVATGTGHAALALAAELPRGRVTGIDFSEGMLAEAKGKLRERGVENVTLHQMDMQALGFHAESFDAAVFSFSLFFVEDMGGLLGHVRGKVRPGGRVLATSFQEGTFCPQVDMFFERVKKYGVEVPARWRRLSSPQECTELFEAAGLKDVRVEAKSVGYHLSEAEGWWEVIWNAGLRRFVSDLSSAELERFRREHMEEIGTLCSKEGLWLEVKVLYTQGGA